MKLKGWGSLLIVGAVLAVLAVFCGVPAALGGDYYYYSEGKRIALTLSEEYVAGPPRSETSSAGTMAASVGSTVVPGQLLPGEKLQLYKVSAETGATAAASSLIAVSPGGAATGGFSPVFKADTTLMVPTDEFIVRFPAGTEMSAILEINRKYGVEIAREASWAPDTYVMKVTGASCLDVANAYAENESVVYALPNFVRIMDRRSQTAPKTKERLVLDSSGKVLPSDTKIPEGSTSYAVREPAKMVLPAGAVSQSVVAPNAVVPYTTVFSDGFEGTFPGTTWSLWASTGSPSWAKTTTRKYAGSYSAYPGTAGPYAADVLTWMWAGPFSLSGAKAARVNFLAWIYTEATNDILYVGLSTDDVNYNGYNLSGNWQATSADANGWVDFSFDVEDLLGSLDSVSQIYVAFVFQSNSATQYEGVYVDKVTVEKVTAYEHISTDVYDQYQWSLSNTGQTYGTAGADIQAVDAWNLSTSGAGVTVAVIDEGVDLVHPDLAANLVAGYDATGGGSAGGPTNNDAHGTSCSGIIAAVTNNSKGVAGVANAAKIMPVRIAYKATGATTWTTTDAWIADGIAWAANNGADVLSNSWGGGTESATINDAISTAKTSGRGGKGCVVVFSTGNYNTTVAYPGYLDTVIGVGALSPCGERKAPSSCDGEYWWGSNYGTALDISAPGVFMYTTDISGTAGYTTDDYVSYFNGTSSAAPVVSGVAALVLAANPALTASQVEQILYANTDDLHTAGWDNLTGYGRVNAQKAVQAALEGATLDRIGIVKAAADDKSTLAVYAAPSAPSSALGTMLASARSLGTGVLAAAQGNSTVADGYELFLLKNLTSGRRALQAFDFPTTVRAPLGAVVVSDNNLGTTNEFLAVGDFDGDSQDEVAVTILTSTGNYRLYIYEMPTVAKGDVGSPVAGFSSLGKDVTGLAAGDFDADGKAELVVLRTLVSGVSSVEILAAPTKVNAALPTPIGKYGNLGKNVIANGVAVGNFYTGSATEIAIAQTLASGNCKLSVYAAPSGTVTSPDTTLASYNNVGKGLMGILGCVAE